MNDELQEIIAQTEHLQLGKALALWENRLLGRLAKAAEKEVLQSLKSDRQLLVDYWQQGYADPQRQQVYTRLLQRLYVAVARELQAERLRGDAYWMGLYNRPRRSERQWSLSAIRSQLESYVGDMALLQLEPEPARTARERALFERHQQLVSELFDYILTSRQWSDGLADGFIEMLLAPTVDAADQQLMVSAVMLSAMQMFDYQKFRVLAEVYRLTSDQSLRQRALVGWVMALDSAKDDLYPEMRQTLQTLTSDPVCLDELTELQMQLIYCKKAESDRSTIVNEIMPDLLNGGRLMVTRHGLVELDEDPLEDILHPEAVEQNMERMEQSVSRMAEMQRQGSDIYYGGFSQMKRFPFFSDLSNWFVPFYQQHPAISQVWQQTRGKRFLQTITSTGAFCDSDKYSFVLAFNQVLDHLPSSMLSLVEQGEASPALVGGEIAPEEQRQPAYMRRQYLQNLYRFFRLHPMRGKFAGLFDEARVCLFFANPLFRGTALQQRMVQMIGFLLKHSAADDAFAVFDACDDTHHDFDFYVLSGRLQLLKCDYQQAGDSYRQALQLQPDSRQALSGMARAAFFRKEYAEALSLYERLLQLQPDHRGYTLNAAACLANLGRHDESLKLLYKLDYLRPGDRNVKRVMAWTLMDSGKYVQALDLYLQLADEAEAVEADDVLNHGFCLWFAGRVGDAVLRLRHYRDLQCGDGEDWTFTADDQSLLRRHGFGPLDESLMLDAIHER